jgi:hypothetical protein
MTVAANIQRDALRRGKASIDRREMVIFFPVWIGRSLHQVIRQGLPFHGSSLPIRFRSAISPPFIARLIKGCRVDGSCGYLLFGENLSTFNALTSILAAKAPLWAHFCCGHRRAKCPS